MSLITGAWSVICELLIEYAFFLPLDLWTKVAIGRVRDQVERQYIWSSEAELLVIAGFVIWMWRKTFPFLLLILAYTTFIFSHGLTLRSGLTKTVSYIKYAIRYIIFILWGMMYKIWFASSISLGNAVSVIFEKVFGESHNNKEEVLKSFLTTFGNYIRTFLSYFINSIMDICSKIYKMVLLWIDLFGNSPWDVYSISPVDCHPPVPAYFTTFSNREQLLCHPDCELSQKSGTYSVPVAFSTNNLDHSNEHSVSAVTRSYSSTYTNSHVGTSVHSVIISYIVYFLSQLAYTSLEVCKSIYYLFVGKTHSNHLLPPGLKNMGQNICYFNAVLQCFVRTPGIVGTLEGVLAAEALAGLHITEAEAQFLHAFRELMLQLSTWTVNDKVLEEFQFYCSTLVPTLVSYSHPMPVQQDASEFIMWLLNKLHECFNTKRDHNYTSVRIRLKRFPILLGIDNSYPLWKAGGEQRSNYFTTTNLPQNTVERLLQLADEEWDSYERNNASPVSALFTSQTVEVHRCLGCDQVSAQTQIFTILPLAFPSSCDEVALSDLVSKFFSVEEVDTNASMQCTCGLLYNRLNNFATVGNRSPPYTPTKVDSSGVINMGTENRSTKTSTPITIGDSYLFKHNAHGKSNSLSQVVSPIGGFLRSPVSVNEDLFSPFKQEKFQTVPSKKWVKQTFLCKAPKCLVMQLMRFCYDTDKRISLKTHQAVEIPLSNLSVPVLQLGGNKQHENGQTAFCKIEYELYGLIVHLGTQSTASGHYVAYCCDRDLNKQTVWYKFDDDIVTRINTLEELNSIHVKRNAYLLFYKQRDTQYLNQETSFRQRGRF